MRALASALLGVAVGAAPALAQRAPRYDPNAEVTVTGVVVDHHEAKRRNDHPGLHFILRIGPALAEEPETASAAAESEAPTAPEPAVPAPPEPTVAAAEEPVPAAEPEPPPPAVEAETVEVHACPMDLLGYLDFKIEKGDELTVTGSRPGDGSIIVAREIVKGEVKLQVRDPEGVPIWTDLP